MTQKHICIDFEGEGKKGSGERPLPHLLGALVPRLDGQGKDYYLFLLRNELAPIERAASIPGKTEFRRTCTLTEAIAQLIELAEARDCRLVGYSIHELNVIQDHLPQRSAERKAFELRWYNVKKKATALRNRLGIDAPDRTLDSLIRALMPKHKSPPPPRWGKKGQAAEACRQLTKAGAKSKHWRSWARRHQELAKDLLAYNRGDCIAVWKLVNRITISPTVGLLGTP